MGFLRRHPPGPQLGAWFDGEQAADDVGAHVSHCARCRSRVSEMARVRAWIRAQPFFAMGEEAESAPSLRRRRPLMVAAALLVGVLLLVPNGPIDGGAGGSRPTGRERAVPLLNSGAEGQARSRGEPAAPTDGDTSAAPPASTPVAVSPLRLGLVVPTTGSSAREGAEVRRSVRHRVDQANASGGVGGAPVELVVVAAEDQAAVSALAGRVTAVVGGFGGPAPPAPPDVPWLFPAEPSVSGPDVVAAEASPQEVGRQMGEVLRRQLLVGPVGVVVGSGPESAMGAGLASKVATTTVAAAADSSCSAEIASLRRAGSVALAVAGPPDLAVRCVRSAARAGWRPPYGTLVAPSAAYAGLEAEPEAHGARTLLALPWPTAPVPGAARFRASSSSRSYRALVSFAATELAIEVARQHGSISLAAVRRSTWRSDLFELDATESRAAPVVAGRRGWMPAPEEARIGPLPLPVPSLPAPPSLPVLPLP